MPIYIRKRFDHLYCELIDNVSANYLAQQICTTGKNERTGSGADRGQYNTTATVQLFVDRKTQLLALSKLWYWW